jgi:alpha-L-fucosidase 2
MLVQSRGDEILLLPALPAAWPTGSIRGLRTRGACSVDLAWQDGRLASAVLTGAIPGTRIVRYRETRRTVRLTPGKPVRLTD